ncbi:MAG: NADH-quinone oxidoreductase subunit J [Isosphaeraceae bacterium]
MSSLRSDELWSLIAVVLGAFGTYLVLPHGRGLLKPRWSYAVGGGLTILAALILAMSWTPPGALVQGVFLYGFSLASLAAGVLMITSRDPVYSALWFAAVVISTSGLFLLAGAQFLAAGTVIVYAGAIIVTFLFVIMLAQAAGRATYDRASRGPGRATITCFVLLWSLTYALLHVRTPVEDLGGRDAVASRFTPASELITRHSLQSNERMNALMDRAIRPTARLGGPGVPHVAGLGGTLYTDHLIVVELAGALLFVALVGAAAIVAPRPRFRPVSAQSGPGEPALPTGL